MTGLRNTIRVQEPRQTLVPVTLAITIAVLGAVLYLELVFTLLEYAG